MQARLSLKRTNRAPGVVGVVREPRTSFGGVAFTEAATRLVNRGVFIVIITNLITLWYLDFPSRFCAPADQSRGGSRARASRAAARGESM